MIELKYAISLFDVNKNFGKQRAVYKVNLRIGKGITLILGPNGAGKSTLLRCMAGLYKPDSGRLDVLGSDPYESADIRNRISFMPDNYGLYDFLSVRDNMLFFARLYGIEDKEAIAKSLKILKMLDAAHYINAKVGQLSRGTKQKILLCKALINDPEVILLDEPTAFLDASSSEQVRRFLYGMADEGKCVVFVTQRVDEATRFNSRICVIKNGSIIRDTDTKGLYDEIFKGTRISIRLARPISKNAVLALGKNMSLEHGGIIKADVKNYKDVNAILKTLMDNGAYIASVDYAEPMIEKLYGGND